jgi:hypothetical protein
VTVAATKPVFQIIAFVVSLYFLYWAYAGASVVANSGSFLPPPNSVKLTLLSLRDDTVPTPAGNPVAFGLLRDGCPLPPAVNVSNGTAVVTFAALPSGSNGYFLKIAANGPAEKDPVSWKVEAQANGDNEWRMVGASVSRGHGALAAHYPRLSYPTPRAEGGESVKVVVDCRPVWPWMLTEVANYAVAGIGWHSYAWSGLMGRQLAAVGILCCLFGSNTVLQFVAAAGYFATDNWRGGVEALIYGASVAVMASLLWLNEALVVIALILFGAIAFLALVCIM